MTVSILIIILTCLISYKAFQNPSVFHQLKHYPYQEARTKEWYRFLSSGFVHGSWAHLIINMYVLYMFGGIVEHYFTSLFGQVFGPVLYIVMYVLTIIVADIPTFLKHKNNPGYASIGASGAVSGVVFIFILFHPWEKLSILFLPFLSFPAIVGGIAYLIYSSWASKNSRDHIDHDAHFYGAVFGMLFIIALKPQLFQLFINQIVSGLPF